MREIKFRAWEEELKIMDYGKELKGGIEYECSPVRAINIILNEDDHGFVYMQYTGLKDKNGKEIYEGDVVEYGLLTGKIIFDSGAFQFEILKSEHSKLIGACDCLIDLSEDGFEIIGNIYEEPELLEVAL